MNNGNLILIRGLPGSGKTTIANKLLDEIGNSFHVEADMFFMRETGKYEFDKEKLKDAHKWCFDMACFALRGERTVIVSNTFVMKWEMEPYINFAVASGMPFKIITATGSYQSVHNVPSETIERMKARWEDF